MKHLNIKNKRFNKGTQQGKKIIKKSLQELGCCRSVLADRDGNIICGHDIYAIANQLGYKTISVETDGNVLVVIKRSDVEPRSAKSLEIELVDDLSQEKNLDWDADALSAAMQEKLSFDPRKWGGYECLVKELNLLDLLRDDVQKKEKNTKKEEKIEMNTQLSLFE